jgi:hypothetical protein
MDDKTKKRIWKDANTLPVLFESLKDMIGNHYIPVPIIYIHKNKTRVPSMSYNKINWLTMNVISKIEFF